MVVRLNDTYCTAYDAGKCNTCRVHNASRIWQWSETRTGECALSCHAEAGGSDAPRSSLVAYSWDRRPRTPSSHAWDGGMQGVVVPGHAHSTPVNGLEGQRCPWWVCGNRQCVFNTTVMPLDQINQCTSVICVIINKHTKHGQSIPFPCSVDQEIDPLPPGTLSQALRMLSVHNFPARGSANSARGLYMKIISLLSTYGSL